MGCIYVVLEELCYYEMGYMDVMMVLDWVGLIE